MATAFDTAEQRRLAEAREAEIPWRKWGPYPILKERLFGLANSEGNHDEDVKEYFHGDNGAGLGASHQTGWTGVIARIMQLFGTITAEQFLEGGIEDVFRRR